MKKYSQFLKELPSKTVVFAFGRFNPPTTGHELLVKAVKKLAATNKADHAIYASKSQDAKKNPLSVDKKVHYLKLMFPNTNFVAANPTERTFIEAAKALNKKYKNLIMVAGSDRIPEYERILNTYNGKDFHYDTVQVISAGERDPDADDATGMSASKMRAVATKGDYSQFKKGLPSAMREIDGRRLMNDVRQGMGLEPIKEHLNLVKDELREQYFRGEIFNIGDIVESAGVQYQIVKRGSNHLLLKEESGKLVSKWLQDVSIVEDVAEGGYAPEEISFGGYTTKNLHHSEDAARAFQDTIARHGKDKPAAVMHALMATDTYMGLSDLHLNQGKTPTETEKEQWIKSHEHAKQHLDELGEFLHHRDYWDNHQHEMEDMLSNYKKEGQSEMNEELTDKTLKSQDKIKVARIIATMLGIDNAETSANADVLVNNALRKVRSKNLNPEAISILGKMLQLATEVGIKVDTTLIPTKLKESEVINTKSTYNAAKDRLRYKDYAKLSKMNKGVAEEDEVDDVGDVAHVDAAAHDRIKATEPQRIVGQSITDKAEDSSDRRQKIQYVSEAEKQYGMPAHSLAHVERKIKMGDWEATHDIKAGRHLEIIDHANGKKRKTIHVKESTDVFAKVAQAHIKKVGGVRHNKYDKKVKTNEEVDLSESHVEFRIDHRDKVKGDHKPTFADHEAKVSDTTDKATYVKVPAHKADSFKSAMKSKHGVKVELAEAAQPYWKKSSWIKKMSQAAKQERLAREKKEKEAQQKPVSEEVEEELEVCEQCGQTPCACDDATLGAHNAKGFDPFFAEESEEDDEDDTNDSDLDDMASEVEDIDDIIDAYDDEELAIVDDETGEEIEDEEVNESALMEVLSRMERMKAKMRIARSKAKRERATKIALRTYSSTDKINKRARRLAVNLMKKRLMRGRDPAKVSVGEKERIERTIEKRKKAIGRLAMRLTSRVRSIEKARMSHSKFTKGAPNVTV